MDTLFDGGATSELVAKIGWDLGSGTDDDDGFLADTSLHADATYVKFGPVAIADVSTETVDETYGTQESTVLASLRTKLNPVLKRDVKVFNDTCTINVIWTSTGANLTALTAGQVKFFFAINNAVAA